MIAAVVYSFTTLMLKLNFIIRQKNEILLKDSYLHYEYVFLLLVNKKLAIAGQKETEQKRQIRRILRRGRSEVESCQLTQRDQEMNVPC